MEEKLTIEEAKAMQGEIFTYCYEDGDSIQAFVKKFDERVGLSCFTNETESRNGWRGRPTTKKEADGTWCVMSYDFVERPKADMDLALRALAIIKRDKMYRAGTVGNTGNGGPTCVFL